MRALFRKPALFALGVVLLLPPAAVVNFIADNRSPENPVDVARSYLRATHARDYREAYRFIASADRIIFAQENYLRAQVALRGFAAQLAKQLAADMEIRVIERETKDNRARLTLDYKVPAADEVSALLYNWDQEKLNALPRAEQEHIIGALEKMKKAGNMINIEGRETFNLVKEDGRWKVFLDWASGIKVSFSATLPSDSLVEVEVLKRELFASADEPFQTNLKFWNRGQNEVVARIDHLIEPREFAGRIAMIACGFLRPLTLYPGEVREVSSAYLLDSGFPKPTQLSITYEVKLGPNPSATSRQSSTASKIRTQ
jgi:hypothetical protein